MLRDSSNRKYIQTIMETDPKHFGKSNSLLEDFIVLYKFLPLDAFESTIENWALKACMPYEANDPLEFTPRANDALSDIKTNSPAFSPPGFLSFTINISSVTMWGHYADSGRGVCLVFLLPTKSRENVFDRRSILSERYIDPDKIHGSDEAKRTAMRCVIQKVRYTGERVENEEQALTIIRRKMEEISHEGDFIKLRQDIDDIRETYYKEWLNRFMSTKAKSWEYEGEVRIITPCTQADKIVGNKVLFSWPMQFLAGVVVGPRCPLSHQIVSRKLALAFLKRNLKDNYIFNNFANFFTPVRDMFDPGEMNHCFIVTRANYHWCKYEVEAAPWYDGMKSIDMPKAFDDYINFANQRHVAPEQCNQSWNDLHPSQESASE